MHREVAPALPGRSEASERADVFRMSVRGFVGHFAPARLGNPAPFLLRLCPVLPWPVHTLHVQALKRSSSHRWIYRIYEEYSKASQIGCMHDLLRPVQVQLPDRRFDDNQGTFLACADSSSVSVSCSGSSPLMVTVSSLLACCALLQTAVRALAAVALSQSFCSGPAWT